MLLDRLFRPRAAQAAGRALYARAVEQSPLRELSPLDALQADIDKYAL